MPVTTAADARRTETPNAVMTTLASPTVGGTSDLVVWRVSMEAGASGPEHAFDAEQVWTVLAGAGTATVDGRDLPLAPGDALLLPAGVVRRIAAVEPFEALVVTRAGTRASAEGREPTVPPWVA